MVQLFNDECLFTMGRIPDNSIDMICCDPPYGTTQCKWDSPLDLHAMWSDLTRIIKPDGAIILFAAQPFTSALISSNYKLFKQSLVWIKNKSTGHLNANRRHMVAHEDIILFSKKQVTYNPQKSTGHKKVTGYSGAKQKTDCYGDHNESFHKANTEFRLPTTLLNFDVVNNDNTGDGRFHPTQKPIALMEYLIKTYSNEGETILDFTMGSGSTGVAAINLNREFIGIEWDDDYFSIAKERISKAQISKWCQNA